MILVLSEEADITTNEVLDWLRHYRLPYVRINKEDRISIEDFTLDRSGKANFVLRVRDTAVPFSALRGFFCRRGFFRFNIRVPDSGDVEIYEGLRNHIRQDALDLNEFVAFMLESRLPHVGECRQQRLNKLKVLQAAAECGLPVPPTFISENLQQIGERLKSEGSLITKGISDTFSAESFRLGISIAGYTARVSREDLESCRRPIAPTLFQTEIQKLLEIRSFYLDGRFYSMAIISQNNPKTQIDYRQYDAIYPNRNVPFQLPEPVEQKLRLLMERLSLSTGSIDLMVDRNGDYYFLEINPVGQFGALSEVCNYALEKKIAGFFYDNCHHHESPHLPVG